MKYLVFYSKMYNKLVIGDRWGRKLKICDQNYMMFTVIGRIPDTFEYIGEL